MFPPSRIVCLTEETVETRYLLERPHRRASQGNLILLVLVGYLRHRRSRGACGDPEVTLQTRCSAPEGCAERMPVNDHLISTP